MSKSQELRSAIAESMRNLADRIEAGHDGLQVPTGTVVCDGDTGERLGQILRIDSLMGEVEQYIEPIQVTPDGQARTRLIRFDRFEPKRDETGRITEVHCYGRAS